MPRQSALSGLRVLDLAGPLGVYATRLLAGLGADVIRIEPRGGDALRRRPPFAGTPHVERSLHHWHFNAGKRSIVLDLDTPAGRDAFRALAADADALVETLPPGGLARLGLDPGRLQGDNPRLVITSITPYGQDGPRADWAAADLTGAAHAGIMAIYGLPGRPPYQPGGEQAFHQAGLAAAVGTLAALWDRAHTGLGQQVDVSLQEALAIAPEGGLGFADIEGKPRGRRGLVTLDGARTLFPCADGWVAGVFGGRWEERIGWLEQAGALSSDEAAEWRDHDVRAVRGTARLDQLTLDLVAALPKEQVYREAQRRRMAISPIQRVSDLLADRQLTARDFFLQVEQPASQTLAHDGGAPLKLSRTPWRIARPAPQLGEHQGQGWLPRSTEVSGGTSHQRSTDPPGRLPLSNIRVLDFTVQGAGPVATRLLANFGAEVIKVETPTHLDGARMLAHPRPEGNSSPNVNGIFNNFSADKLGVTVQLDALDGRDIIRALVAISDVVVDNFGRDPFPRWGLTPDVLFEIRPDLIIARSSVMGRSGPDRDYIGFGYGVAAAAGLTSLTGFPDEPPLGAGALADFTCNPHHLAAGILAALDHRRRTGEGQMVDLSQVESTISVLGPSLLDYQITGRDSAPQRNRSLEMAPHGVYPCSGSDRWIAIAVQDDQAWERLCVVAEQFSGDEEPGWATFAGRKVDEDALDRAIGDWTREQDAVLLAERLQVAGIAAAPVATTLDLLHADEHLKQRRYHRWIEHPEAGVRAHDGPPFRLMGCSAGPNRPAPRLGEHTDLVLRALLGYDEERIGSLYVNGAVG